jgi:hypothetical protein
VNLKERAARDLERVILNTGELAETVEIEYGGETFTAPAVLDYFAQDKEIQSGSVLFEGAYLCDHTLYMNRKDAPKPLEKGRPFTVNGARYRISKVAEYWNLTALSLERAK